MTSPKLAVVGHPNKGKSSIVSTLVRQDAVAVSELSGTTTQSQSFSMMVDGKELYQLVDTPGFQRPRQVLEILQAQTQDASQRRQTVQAFLHQYAPDGNHKFKDEAELLEPIVNGAGIVYVVDGSVPYSPEYEAEMTILQWTGQPRMALINPIGGEHYVEQWQAALSQFFSVVRVFNPMTADGDKQRQILSAFAELHEPWRTSLEQAQQLLAFHLNDLQRQGGQMIAEALQQMAQYQSKLPIVSEHVDSAAKYGLRHQYEAGIRSQEKQMQQHVCELYSHHQLQLENETLEVDYPDLFDRKSWYLFGLDRTKLVGLAASAGAAAGVAIDVGVGGSSLMAGAVAGGVLSGAATLYATLKPERLKLKGMPLGGQQLVAGPIKDISFLFVLFGRAVELLAQVSRKTHADRRVVVVSGLDFSERFNQLSKVDQVKLTRLLQRLHKGLSFEETERLKRYIIDLVAFDKPD
ncbi:GTPase/DUF3482 domain-containing protein [Reinekea marinisedimentorum]|uniref:Small GTP-binding protein n=1 Tax=Reinekea marinisedimentorum TaxID=230495 RepID=A0A4R3I5T2_9GAMM|nr:GTPase/DUF3482 domain-containing protein [Reinekea marinisedimentorum]TCS41378.1 small GTP-binding protein [Reinekea marinisedimentorum]